MPQFCIELHQVNSGNVGGIIYSHNVSLFCSPAIHGGLNPLFKSYDLFFQVLREGKYQDFTSTLEADLERE